MIEAVGKLLKIDDAKSDSYFSTFQIFKAISNWRAGHEKVYLTISMKSYLVRAGNKDNELFPSTFEIISKQIFFKAGSCGKLKGVVSTCVIHADS